VKAKDKDRPAGATAAEHTKPAPPADGKPKKPALSKRERWLKLANSRTNKAMRALDALGNCGNPQSYEWADGEREKVIDTVLKRVEILRKKLFPPEKVREEFKLF
jgi:hypothetical protein